MPKEEAIVTESAPEIRAVPLGGQPVHIPIGLDRAKNKETGAAFLEEIAAAIKPFLDVADAKTDHGGAKVAADFAYRHLLFTAGEIKEY